MKFTMKKLRLNHLKLQYYCMYLNGWKMKLNFQILLLYMVKGFVNPYTTIIGWVVKWTMNHYVLNLHFPYVNQCWLQSPTSESAPFLFFTLPLDFIWRTEYQRRQIWVWQAGSKSTASLLLWFVFIARDNLGWDSKSNA